MLKSDTLKGHTQREVATRKAQEVSRGILGMRSPGKITETLNGMNATITDLTRSRYTEGYEEGLRAGVARVHSNFEKYDVIVKATMTGTREDGSIGKIEFCSTLQEVAYSMREIARSSADEGVNFKIADLNVSVGGVICRESDKKQAKKFLEKVANWTSGKHASYVQDAEVLASGIASYMMRQNKTAFTNSAEIDWEVVSEVLLKQVEGEKLSKAEVYLLKLHAPEIEEFVNSNSSKPKR